MLYIVDSGTRDFEQARTAVDVVCAGDSLTGWNNIGRPHEWPYPTYPQYLEEMCGRLHDQHFGDALHPNGDGATIIAEKVFGVLRALVEASSIEDRK